MDAVCHHADAIDQLTSGPEVQTTPAQSAKMQAMAAENNSQSIKYTLTGVVPKIAEYALRIIFASVVNCFRLFSSTEWPDWSGDSKPRAASISTLTAGLPSSKLYLCMNQHQ